MLYVYLDFLAYKVDLLVEVEDFNNKDGLFVEAENSDNKWDSLEEIEDINSFIVFWLGFVNWAVSKVCFWSLNNFYSFIKFHLIYNIFFRIKIIFETNDKLLNNLYP